MGEDGKRYWIFKNKSLEILNIYGILGALFIGFVLGLTGAGGSILTVPIMVYVLHINPVTATAYSLFVVGTTSFVGDKNNFLSYLNCCFPSLIFICR